MSPATISLPGRHILLVDHDRAHREQIAAYLAKQGFCAHAAESEPTMGAILAASPVDLIILDVVLPGEDGFSICRRLSDRGGPPVIIVSASGEEVDRVLGLELGAADYLTKPCSPRELLARVRAVLRRLDEGRGGADRQAALYRFRGFTVNAQQQRLHAPDGASIPLTRGEYSLLRIFLDQSERLLSRGELLEQLRGGGSDIAERAVDVQISRLRRKLHACVDDEIIRTIRGMGYLFDAKVARA